MDDLIYRQMWEFEDAWKSAVRPELETYLNDPQLLAFGPQAAAALLEVLLPSELHHRQRIGEVIQFQDFANRFPAHYAVLERHRDRFPVSHQLGIYRLISRIGAGGTGEVWLAEHQLKQVRVAIKRLRGRLVSGDSATRFLREMQVLSQLRGHPNLVSPTFDEANIDPADGHPYLIMELVEGVNLDQLAAKSRLRMNDACEIIRQAANGIEYAHQRQIIHRDLKPANLMVTRDGIVKVLDFGMAKWQADQAQGTEWKPSGAIVGTLGYMAPEQVSEQQVDCRADVYGLAATLYRLLTGQPPIVAHSLIESVSRLARLTQEPIRPLADFRDDLPESLIRAVDRALLPDPALRTPSVTLFREAIEPFVVGHDLHSAVERRWPDFHRHADLTPRVEMTSEEGNDLSQLQPTITFATTASPGTTSRLGTTLATAAVLIITILGTGLLMFSGPQAPATDVVPLEKLEFNGRDLTGLEETDAGFSGIEFDPHRPGWRVEQEVLVGDGQGSCLLVKDTEFRDFEAVIEFLAQPDGNAGFVFNRSQNLGYLEVDLLANKTGDIVWVRPWHHEPVHQTGHQLPRDWATLKVVSLASRVTVWLNDLEIVSVKLDSKRHPLTGKLGFSRWDPGNWLRIRKFEVRRLSTAAKTLPIQLDTRD